MSSPTEFDPVLLDRYLAHEASESERAQIEAWAAADARNSALLDKLRSTSASRSDASDTDASWRQLAARMDQPPARTAQPPVILSEAQEDRKLRVLPARGAPPAARPRWFREAWRAAAVVLLLVGGSGVWWMQRDRVHIAQAPRGSRTNVVLPDGSTIMLAAGSSARWLGNFERGTRDITLEGEGYFTVVHDTTRRFRVHARDGVVEDVGTRFVVRAWPELARLEVAVEEGAATLTDSARARTAPGTLLRAGQVGRLGRDGAVTVSDNADALLSWTRGELVFDDTPLSEALPALGRWYGVELRADTSLRTRRLNARFAKQPLSQLLDALALALDARVVRDPATSSSIFLTPVTK